MGNDFKYHHALIVHQIAPTNDYFHYQLICPFIFLINHLIVLYMKLKWECFKIACSHLTQTRQSLYNHAKKRKSANPHIWEAATR